MEYVKVAFCLFYFFSFYSYFYFNVALVGASDSHLSPKGVNNEGLELAKAITHYLLNSGPTRNRDPFLAFSSFYSILIFP